MVALDAFEQGLEVAFAEAFVALALDDLEEDRAERVLGEDLQQLALLGFRVGVDQDLVLRQPRHVLAVVGHALVDHLEVGVRRSEEHTSELQSLMRISYAVFCLKKKKIQFTHLLDNTITINMPITSVTTIKRT